MPIEALNEAPNILDVRTASKDDVTRYVIALTIVRNCVSVIVFLIELSVCKNDICFPFKLNVYVFI